MSLDKYCNLLVVFFFFKRNGLSAAIIGYSLYRPATFRTYGEQVRSLTPLTINCVWKTGCLMASAICVLVVHRHCEILLESRLPFGHENHLLQFPKDP